MWPTTQVCALTRNQTGDSSVCSMTPSPMSHTGQGPPKLFLFSTKPLNGSYLWEVMMIALPLLLIHVTMSQRRRRATGSMPVDGSSRKTTEGFPIRAIAVFNLRLFPLLYHHKRGEKVEEKEKNKGTQVINS